MNRRGFIGLFVAAIVTPMVIVSGKRRMIKRKVLKTKPEIKAMNFMQTVSISVPNKNMISFEKGVELMRGSGKYPSE